MIQTSMADERILTFLQTTPTFSDLEQNALHTLARVCHFRKLSKGEYLFFQDDPGDAAYVVAKGTIDILFSTEDGRELVVNEMREGDFFGELALLQEAPRSASAVAQEDSILLWIPRREFLNEVERQPKLMRQLLEVVANRLRNSGERETALAFLDASTRLSRFLIQRAALEDENADLVTISQEEIARYIGVTRQTVAKILGEWRRNDWIITGRGRIMLVDLKALKKLAE